MSTHSVNDYAYAHARIRGRIGKMPDEQVWQQIIHAGDLETTIESMSGSGLKYWVNDFPRHPSPQEIERRCLISLLGVCIFVDAHFPERWKRTGIWLLQLPHVLQLRAVMSSGIDKKQLLPGSPFLDVSSQAVENRKKALQDGPYGTYLDASTPPESVWAGQFESTLPRADARERHTVTRLVNLLNEHFQSTEPDMTTEQVWIQRSSLFERLKEVLAGDPFHIGTLLIYALLESIQFERVRAVLLLRAYQWPTRLLGGLA